MKFKTNPDKKEINAYLAFVKSAATIGDEIGEEKGNENGRNANELRIRRNDKETPQKVGQEQ